MNVLGNGLYVMSDAYWRTKAKTTQVHQSDVAPAMVPDSLDNYSAVADRERRQHLYLMKTGLTTTQALVPGGRKPPTRALKHINQKAWGLQDWETIEVMDDTRKIWASNPEWADETQFRFDGLGKKQGYPFKAQPLARKFLYGNGYVEIN